MTNPAELARAFYEAVSRSDVPGVIGLLHPDLHWTEAEGFPYKRYWRTPREVVDKLLVPLMRDWMISLPWPTTHIVEGVRVVSLGAYGGINKATGKAMRAPFAHVWRVADGKLAQGDVHGYAPGSPRHGIANRSPRSSLFSSD